MSNSTTPWTAAHQAPLSSISPRVCSNSCPLNRWCDLTISSSVAPLLLLPSIFPSIMSFQWVNSSHQVAKVLELQLQHQSLQWVSRVDFFKIGLISLLSKGLSRVFSSTTCKTNQVGINKRSWNHFKLAKKGCSYSEDKERPKYIK